MKKNQAQKFIVLFLFFLFAYSWRVEAQTGKEKQITMEFKNEGLPSIFKRFEKVSGYKVLFIYDEISSYTSTGKVEKATVDEALKVIIGKNPLKYPNTNWLEETFKSSVAHNHVISMNGGSEKIKFYSSFGYQNNPGVMENTGFEKYNARLNASRQASFSSSVILPRIGLRKQAFRRHTGLFRPDT